jgi:hypothetical protein
MRTIHGAIPSWPGLSRPSTSSTGAGVSYTVGACRLSAWAACKSNHMDGLDKPGHDGKWHGNQDLISLFLSSAAKQSSLSRVGRL